METKLYKIEYDLSMIEDQARVAEVTKRVEYLTAHMRNTPNDVRDVSVLFMAAMPSVQCGLSVVQCDDEVCSEEPNVLRAVPADSVEVFPKLKRGMLTVFYPVEISSFQLVKDCMCPKTRSVMLDALGANSLRCIPIIDGCNVVIDFDEVKRVDLDDLFKVLPETDHVFIYNDHQFINTSKGSALPYRLLYRDEVLGASIEHLEKLTGSPVDPSEIRYADASL